MWKLLFVILLVLLAIGCQATASVPSDEWVEQTSRLITISAESSGAYHEAPSGILRQANIYATYYAVETLHTLGSSLPEEQQQSLVRWLNTLYSKGTINIVSGDEVSDLFYWTQLVGAAQLTDKQQSEIIETLNQLQFADSTYALSARHHAELLQTGQPDADYTYGLLTAYQAVTIFDTVGGEPLQKETLTRWFEAAWDDIVAQQPVDVRNLELAHKGLVTLDPTNSRLTQSWKILETTTQSDDWLLGEFPLFQLAAAVALAQEMNHTIAMTPAIDNFVTTLSGYQNSDGGFNAFLESTSDWLGTTLALTVLDYFGGSFDQATSKQLMQLYTVPDGGFAPIVTVEGDRLRPTWGVLQIASYLDSTLASKPQTAQFIAQKWETETDIRALALIIKSAEMLDLTLSDTHNQVANTVTYLTSHNHFESNESASTLYDALTILTYLDAEIPTELSNSILADLEQHRLGDDSFGIEGQPNVELTAKALLLQTALQQPIKTETIKWLQEQYQSNGFIETGQENPLLPTTYWAVLALDHVGQAPLQPAKIANWLENHLAADGGAAPTIEIAHQDGEGSLFWAGVVLELLSILNR